MASTEHTIVGQLVDYLLDLHDSHVSIFNVLYRLIHHDRIKSLIIPLSYYSVMVQMLINLESELCHISRHAHQSGLYQFLLSAVSGHVPDSHDIAVILNIDVRTALKAKASRLDHHNHYRRHGSHRSHLLKTITKRKRISEETCERIADFIEDNTIPTANSKNVKLIRNALGHAVAVPVRYRTDTIKDLHQMYCVCAIHSFVSSPKTSYTSTYELFVRLCIHFYYYFHISICSYFLSLFYILIVSLCVQLCLYDYIFTVNVHFNHCLLAYFVIFVTIYPFLFFLYIICLIKHACFIARLVLTLAFILLQTTVLYYVTHFLFISVGQLLTHVQQGYFVIFFVYHNCLSYLAFFTFCGDGCTVSLFRHFFAVPLLLPYVSFI